jgi:hypothetical protein
VCTAIEARAGEFAHRNWGVVSRGLFRLILNDLSMYQTLKVVVQDWEVPKICSKF